MITQLGIARAMWTVLHEIMFCLGQRLSKEVFSALQKTAARCLSHLWSLDGCGGGSCQLLLFLLIPASGKVIAKHGASLSPLCRWTSLASACPLETIT